MTTGHELSYDNSISIPLPQYFKSLKPQCTSKLLILASRVTKTQNAALIYLQLRSEIAVFYLGWCQEFCIVKVEFLQEMPLQLAGNGLNFVVLSAHD